MWGAVTKPGIAIYSKGLLLTELLSTPRTWEIWRWWEETHGSCWLRSTQSLWLMPGNSGSAATQFLKLGSLRYQHGIPAADREILPFRGIV
eukprot:s901_g24.t1